MASDTIAWVQLLIKLGLAVYDAVRAGDTGRTVGEIFAGVGRDEDEIKRLEDTARAHFDSVRRTFVP